MKQIEGVLTNSSNYTPLNGRISKFVESKIGHREAGVVEVKNKKDLVNGLYNLFTTFDEDPNLDKKKNLLQDIYNEIGDERFEKLKQISSSLQKDSTIDPDLIEKIIDSNNGKSNENIKQIIQEYKTINSEIEKQSSESNFELNNLKNQSEKDINLTKDDVKTDNLLLEMKKSSIEKKKEELSKVKDDLFFQIISILLFPYLIKKIIEFSILKDISEMEKSQREIENKITKKNTELQKHEDNNEQVSKKIENNKIKYHSIDLEFIQKKPVTEETAELSTAKPLIERENKSSKGKENEVSTNSKPRGRVSKESKKYIKPSSEIYGMQYELEELKKMQASLKGKENFNSRLNTSALAKYQINNPR